MLLNIKKNRIQIPTRLGLVITCYADFSAEKFTSLRKSNRFLWIQDSYPFLSPKVQKNFLYLFNHG
ncbi:hypothetical protein DsansV1_C13g0118021 [Dioscorea sansibarensis]